MGFVPVPPSGDRSVDSRGRLTFLPGPNPLFGNVSAVRTSADELDAFRKDIATWFAARGRSECTWLIGPSTTPANLAALLAERGATPLELGTGTAMVLDAPPPGSSTGIDVRPIETREQLAAVRRLLFFLGDEPPADALAAVEAGLDEAWADYQAMDGQRRYFLAYVDDRPVSAGGLGITEHPVGVLGGGATARDFRGRGCYAALVRARWDAAQAAGCPALIVHASEMSRPVLAALGFRPVGNIVAMLQRI